MMSKEDGPNPEPCTTLALIWATADKRPANRMTCERSLRKLTIKLYISSGMSRRASLRANLECRTVSNALVKSSEMRAT